jgi:uncharacterized protein
MLVIYDEPKRIANLTKHGLDFADFEVSFGFGDFLARIAKPASDGRDRFMLIGSWNGEIVVAAIVSSLGSEAMSLISLRPASREERKAFYERS